MRTENWELNSLGPTLSMAIVISWPQETEALPGISSFSGLTLQKKIPFQDYYESTLLFTLWNLVGDTHQTWMVKKV